MEQAPLFCPHCGFGEVTIFEGDEYYTPGYWFICDCGLCVGVEPRMSYEDWAAQAECIRAEKHEVICRQTEIEPLIEKANEAIGKVIDRRVRKIQKRTGNPIVATRDFMADGKDFKNLGPKTQARRTELHNEMIVLKAKEDELQREYGVWRNVYPNYARQFDALKAVR